jgi:hypothetical protein
MEGESQIFVSPGRRSDPERVLPDRSSGGPVSASTPKVVDL